MLGQTVFVVRDIDPEGKIEYFSEIWNAVSKGEKFSVGDKVCIAGFKGMDVLVERALMESHKPAKRFTCFLHRL